MLQHTETIMTKKPITISRLSPRSAKKVASKAPAKPRTAPAKSTQAKLPRVTRAVQVEAMLRRPQGATTAEIAEAMGTQEHTVRALISTERRKQGWDVTLEERRYRITSPSAR